MDLSDPFNKSRRAAVAKRPGAKGRTLVQGTNFTVELGATGAAAQAAVRALIELGNRQKVGRRLGAEAVIKAERR